MLRLAAALVLAVLLAAGAAAQDFSALARLDPARTSLHEAEGGLAVELHLSQPVPWRVSLMAAPPRLVLDFRELRFDGLEAAGVVRTPRVAALRSGRFRPGWSRLVVELDGPYRVAEAGMARDGAGPGARLALRLEAVSADDFDAAIAMAPPAAAPGWDLPAPAPAPPPRRRQTGEGPLVVVLDPGHGGIDPGAERDGLREADLMLTFARELRDALLRAGGFRVVLTRDDDIFVPLETRVTIARAAGADVFLSLHADAIEGAGAAGSTVYTLSAEASDEVAARLAERHDRADLLAGVDLSGEGDLIAAILMDLARTETAPRSARLAAALVEGIGSATGRMHRRPHQTANFTVLRAPDIPSALIELGYLSSPRDLAALRDPAWRATIARGIVGALQRWALEDAAEALLLRQ
jgi:N-acetylmuramoyl-L-alanine amidase